MPIDLYMADLSPPCLTVRLAAKAIGVELNLKPVSPMAKEHISPQFLKLNPQHTIPTIVDNGFSLWESRAIITYLQNQYGKDDSLYPKDPKKRAVVDQRLYFDISSLHQSVREYFVRPGSTPNPDKLEQLNKVLGFLDTFVKDSEFAAGNHFTLADISLVVSVLSLENFGFDLSPYKNVTRWFAKVKQTAPGFQELVAIMKEARKKMEASRPKK